jgi:hypothetical protein
LSLIQRGKRKSSKKRRIQKEALAKKTGRGSIKEEVDRKGKHKRRSRQEGEA